MRPFFCSILLHYWAKKSRAPAGEGLPATRGRGCETPPGALGRSLRVCRGQRTKMDAIVPGRSAEAHGARHHEPAPATMSVSATNTAPRRAPAKQLPRFLFLGLPCCATGYCYRQRVRTGASSERRDHDLGSRFMTFVSCYILTFVSCSVTPRIHDSIFMALLFAFIFAPTVM